jgi:hypothetical protein
MGETLLPMSPPQNPLSPPSPTLVHGTPPVVDGATPDGALLVDCVVIDPELEHTSPSTSPPATLPAVTMSAMVEAALMTPPDESPVVDGWGPFTPQVSTYFASWFFGPAS